MRDCRKMIEKIKKSPEVYAYIQSLIQEKADMFVAIRENYLNIYYLGASLAKIRFDEKNSIVFELHKKYMGLDEDGYMCLSWEKHKEYLDKITISRRYERAYFATTPNRFSRSSESFFSAPLGSAATIAAPIASISAAK